MDTYKVAPEDRASPTVTDGEIEESLLLEAEISKLEAQSGHLSAVEEEHLEACELRQEILHRKMVLYTA
jgi:hypothetical protein